MPTLRSLHNVRQFYCVLRLLCIALVMNQTKTLQVWNLDAWNLEPGLEPWNYQNLQPRNPGNLQLWNLGTLPNFGTLPDDIAETCCWVARLS